MTGTGLWWSTAVDTEPSRAPETRPRPRAPMQSMSNGCSEGARGSPRPGRRGAAQWSPTGPAGAPRRPRAGASRPRAPSDLRAAAVAHPRRPRTAAGSGPRREGSGESAGPRRTGPRVGARMPPPRSRRSPPGSGGSAATRSPGSAAPSGGPATERTLAHSLDQPALAQQRLQRRHGVLQLRRAVEHELGLRRAARTGRRRPSCSAASRRGRGGRAPSGRAARTPRAACRRRSPRTAARPPRGGAAHALAVLGVRRDERDEATMPASAIRRAASPARREFSAREPASKPRSPDRPWRRLSPSIRYAPMPAADQPRLERGGDRRLARRGQAGEPDGGAALAERRPAVLARGLAALPDHVGAARRRRRGPSRTTMPAATVALVASSIRMKLPVARLSA